MPETIVVRDPADQREVVASYEVSDAAGVAATCERALAGAEEWGATPSPARAAALHRAAVLLEGRAEEVAKGIVREEGKLLSDAFAETGRAVSILRYHAGEAERLAGEAIDAEQPQTLAYTRPRPLGVVALITPWNFPIAIPAWKAAPALAAGNAVVIKPSSKAPGATVALADALHEAGVPEAAMQVLIGGGAVARELVDRPEVRAVSFTGSNAVGSQLSRALAARGVRFQGELGGHNPLLVLADADLEAAAQIASAGAFLAAGQKCTATRRVIVEAPVREAFAAELARRAGAMRVGPGLDESSQVPPLVDRGAADDVLAAIAQTVEQGARPLAGGGAPADGGLEHGAFVAPTVLDGVRAGMAVIDEEVFGPVCSVIEAADVEEAIAIANDTPYGLSASICTNDLRRAFQFVQRIDAGMVHVNRQTPGADPHLPFGGVKASSASGWREQGRAAIAFFTEGQTVYVHHGG